MAVGGSHRGGNGRAGNGRSASLPPPNGEARAGTRKVFKIASNFAAGHEVQLSILADVKKAGFDQHCFFAIKLALEEALVNAIKHGNRLDPEKTVVITASVTARRAEITVEDQGPGFERNNVPDPTWEENLEKCSGRGILLIESYMNRVRWDRGGRRLKMVKDNKPDREC